MRKSWITVSTAIALVGCSPVDRYGAESVNKLWRTENLSAGVIANPMFPVDTELRAFVAQGLAANHRIRAACFDVRDKELSRLLGKATLGFQVVDQIGYERYSYNGSSDPIQTLGPQLYASYDLDLWGEGSLKQRAAYWLAAAAYERLVDTQIAVVASIAEAYWSLIAYKHMLGIRWRIVDDRRLILQIDRTAVAAGALTPDATQAALTNFELSKEDFANAEEEASKTKNQLASLLGRQSAMDGVLQTGSKNLPQMSRADYTPSLSQIRVLPRVRAVEAEFLAAQAAAVVDQRAFLPDISVYGLLLSPGLSLVDALTHPATELAATLSLPFFRYRVLVAQSQISKNQEARSAAALSESILDAANSLQDDALAFSTSKKNTLDAIGANSGALASLTATQARVASGFASSLDFIAADLKAADAQEQLDSSKLREIKAAIDIFRDGGSSHDLAAIGSVQQCDLP